MKRKRNKGGPGFSALSVVKNYFPETTHVKDATESIEIEVTARDNASAAVRKHDACAMAVACKRMTHADGVIVSIGTVYVVKGTIATRYKTTPALAREVVSFDRGHDFSPGEYLISAPSPSSRLGGSKNNGSHHNTGTGKPTKRVHFTKGIRTVLGGPGRRKE